MTKRVVVTTVVVATVHGFVAIGSFVIGHAIGMAELDSGGEMPATASVLMALSEALSWPAVSLWTPWCAENLPDVAEWGLFIANSLLWAFGIALVLQLPALLRGRNEAVSLP